MAKDGSSPILRINNISLGPFERRVLPWMARRLPAWVMPDHLTYLGQFAALLIGFSYWLTHYSLDWLWLTNFAFVLHWYGDSLDGTLARVRNIQRERYGFFVDHYSDAVAVFLICMGMGVSPIMDLRVALMLIVGYYAMMMLVYLVSLARDVFKISFGGFGPTEVRLATIIANIVVWSLHNPTVITIDGVPLTLFSVFGLAVFGVLGVFYVIFGTIEQRKLARLDPTPDQGASPRSETMVSIPAPSRGVNRS
ncbi:MAG TPA: CDP-alcohol phosphatidyltransferase family protein [bacterium]|jgi:phosphatidylglycerophosphate synthase